MKEVARQYFWWPLISKQIEDLANSCDGCKKYRRKPAPAPLCPWPYARRPMERVHIDFCEYKGKQLLIMVDAYSKYIWTSVMNNDTTSVKTLAILYSWFCDRPGFPTTLVSDNGPQFTSKEFAEKMAKWGIKHILTPPYHAASNGLAERAVGTIKSHLKKMDSPATPIELYVNIQTTLRVHRSTPQTSTGHTPYELISKAIVPRLFYQLQPSQHEIQEKNRASVAKDKVRRAREFQQGDSVLVYDTQTRVNSKGVVKDCQSNNSYIVLVNDREKHISGDHMSLLPKDRSDNVSVNDKEVVPDKVLNDNEDSCSSDTVSVLNYDSDSDDDDEDLVYSSLPSVNVHFDNVPRRKYRSESQKLHDSLSVNPPVSRLRSGN